MRLARLLPTVLLLCTHSDALLAQSSTPPKLLTANIHDGANDINPAVKELVLRFNVPMRKTGGDVTASVGADPHIGRGSFDESGLIYTVPISLAPETHYEVTAGNSFVTATGAPVQPEIIHFTTTRTWSDQRFIVPEEGIVYGEAGGVKLTMDYYRPAGKGPHPVAVIIHGGGFVAGTSRNGSEAYCADFLAPAGYAVFSINYRLYPRFTLEDMVQDVQRAVRYIRFNAQKWDADPARIALVGGSAGGFLSNMAGLLAGDGDAHAKDPVDRESATVQAVVTLFGLSDFRSRKPSGAMEPAYGHWSVAEASPITHITPHAPPFLLIHGDKDESVPLDQSTRFQEALKAEGARCDLIVIPNGPHATGSWYRIPGVPDWEKQMTEWLNSVLHHEGTIGPGIRARAPKA